MSAAASRSASGPESEQLGYGWLEKVRPEGTVSAPAARGPNLIVEDDLLFTDLLLPGGATGRQLTEQLFSLRPALKIVFTSSCSPDFADSQFVLPV